MFIGLIRSQNQSQTIQRCNYISIFVFLLNRHHSHDILRFDTIFATWDHYFVCNKSQALLHHGVFSFAFECSCAYSCFGKVATHCTTNGKLITNTADVFGEDLSVFLIINQLSNTFSSYRMLCCALWIDCYLMVCV